MQENIYDYVLQEEISFKTRGVPVIDGYEFKMYEHIKLSLLAKNSKFSTGIDDGNRPFRNIIRPILNVAYRSEGFDVKDIEPFVDDEENYYKSLLIRKFHDKWAYMNDMDTFIDNLVESYVDLGLALVKKVKGKTPEVVPLQMLAFCDQTDILSGPLAIKHQFSPDQLIDMEKQGWYGDKIDFAITMSKNQKANSQVQGEKAKTPGKYIEVYEIHGVLPTSWLEEEEGTTKTAKYIRQAHYICYYKDENDEKKGICLWRGREPQTIFKALVRDPIFGRAAGFGGIEELFESQVWTNYSMIHMKEMMDKAALMLLQTSNKDFAQKNKIQNLSKGEILVHDPNEPITQVAFQPINYELFESAVNMWEQHARTTGSASDPQLGVNSSGTQTLGEVQTLTAQGEGIHDWRRGKVSTFAGEIYRDWLIPDFVSELLKGNKWQVELTLDELNAVADNVATDFVNQKIKEDVINHGIVATPDQQKAFIEQAKKEFMKRGTKHFMEIMKGEMKDVPVDVRISIGGKQANLSKMTNQLFGIIREIISTPQILAIPPMAKAFSQVMEYSGFSPIDFTGLTAAQLAPPAPAQLAPGGPVPSNVIPNAPLPTTA